MSEPPVQHTQFQYDRDRMQTCKEIRVFPVRTESRPVLLLFTDQKRSEKADRKATETIDRDTWRPSTGTAGVTPGSPGGPPAPATKASKRPPAPQFPVRNFELGIGYWTEKLLITKKSWNYEIDTSCGIYALMTRKSRSLPASNSYKLGKLFMIETFGEFDSPPSDICSPAR